MLPDMPGNDLHRQPPSITLDRMPQQARIETANDDWTGQSNQAERRRRQNRVNQRALSQGQKRKEEQSERQSQATFRRSNFFPTLPVSSSWSSNSSSSSTTSSPSPIISDTDGPWPTFSSAISCRDPAIQTLSYLAFSTKTSPSQKTLRQFHHWVSQQRSPSPTTDHMLTLIKFNVFKALTSNCVILGFPIEMTMEDHALSPFTPCSLTSVKPAVIPRLPASLQPTKMQRTIPHHPWIDVLPFPVMRDNLILAGAWSDDIDLCEDLCGLYNAPKSGAGLIIWGEPWDVGAWEIRSEFVEKWPWVVAGCRDLMESTNNWRRRRGEKGLNFGTSESRFEEME